VMPKLLTFTRSLIVGVSLYLAATSVLTTIVAFAVATAALLLHAALLRTQQAVVADAVILGACIVAASTGLADPGAPALVGALLFGEGLWLGHRSSASPTLIYKHTQ
jgi:hypothetical protein